MDNEWPHLPIMQVLYRWVNSNSLVNRCLRWDQICINKWIVSNYDSSKSMILCGSSRGPKWFSRVGICRSLEFHCCFPSLRTQYSSKLEFQWTSHSWSQMFIWQENSHIQKSNQAHMPTKVKCFNNGVSIHLSSILYDRWMPSLSNRCLLGRTWSQETLMFILMQVA